MYSPSIARFLAPGLLALGFSLSSLSAAEAPIAATPAEITAGLGMAFDGLSLSPDGRWLIFSTTKGAALYDRDNAKDPFANVKPGWVVNSDSPRGSWAPSGKDFGFYRYREGKFALSVWTLGTPGDPHELMVNPRTLFPAMPPVWAPDGKTLFVVLNQNLRWQKMPPSGDNPTFQSTNVYLGLTSQYGENITFSSFDPEYDGATAIQFRSVIVAVDTLTGKFGVLAKGNDVISLFPSPDGRKLAVIQQKGDLGGNYGKQHSADIFVLDVPEFSALKPVDLEKFEERVAGWSDHQGRRPAPVLTNILLNYTVGGFYNSGGTNGYPAIAWAPDSSGFAYATTGKQATGDIFFFDQAAQQARNLTEKVELEPSAKGIGYAQNQTSAATSRKFGSIFNPLWLPDSKTLVVAAEGDAWLVPLAAGAAPRNLTEKFAAETLRVLPSPNLAVASVDAGGRVALLTRDRTSRYDSIWKLDLATGETTRIADTGVWTNITLRTDARGEQLTYTGQTVTSAANFYRLELKPGAVPQRLTEFRLQLADRVFPESRVLHWTTPDGYPAYGLLYLPPGTSAANPAPLVVNAYPERGESYIDTRARLGAKFYSEDIQGLLLDGMAVLLPDVPMSDWGVYEGTMKQMVDGVNAATDAAVATGLVDEKRMGLVGQTFGGLLVSAVITQTDRFKTAVTIGGFDNWYGAFFDLPDGPNYSIQAEGRFGKALWEDPHRYADNSPISYLDKVKTPLLIVHGEGDRVPVRYAWNTMAGLQMLGKTAIVASYNRVGSAENPEALQRIRGWMREYLFGAKPITQVAEQGSFFFGGTQAGDVPTTPVVTPVPAAAPEKTDKPAAKPAPTPAPAPAKPAPRSN